MMMMMMPKMPKITKNAKNHQKCQKTQKMQKITEAGGLAFFQKRMKDIKIGANDYDDAEVITGFQYIVMRTGRS